MTPNVKKIHPSELSIFHRNPRIGNVDVIAHSLRSNSQYKPVVVNIGTHTGRKNEILAGNHTVMAFRDLAASEPDEEQWQGVWCWMVDVDEDRAIRIVTADNRTNELGSIDDDALLELLDTLPDLDGTGYGEEDLSGIREAASDHHDNPPPSDPPEPNDDPTADWPSVKIRVSPVLFERFDLVPGETHGEKLTALIDPTDEEGTE